MLIVMNNGALVMMMMVMMVMMCCWDVDAVVQNEWCFLGRMMLCGQ